VKQNFDIPVSLDTYKSAVARAGAAAGVDFINDIWGLKYDDKIADVISEYKLPCCLMHNRNEAKYSNFMEDVINDLKESVAIAHKVGIEDERIVLDPGVGFGKTYENNLEIIKRLGELKQLGYPLLLGCSRKSVIGLTLNLPVEERLSGTIVTTVFGVMSGCGFVRVHDIKENVRAVRMAEAIMEAGNGR
ncbi:MAG: dihydropteroate synthase, partial [Acetatifactor sp.]|nr:dihydropteroate synthase [Acetatifactor sp.]